MFKIGRQQKIRLTKGDDADFRIHLYNGNSEIKPLTGTLTMSVRKYPEGTLLFSIDSDEEGYFMITHDLTEDADTGLYMYDLQYTDNDGYVSTVIVSEFELTEEVT